MQSPRESFAAYQRLIANPFLAVLSVAVVFLLLRSAVQQRSLPLFLIGLVLLPLALVNLHFHCLDCGATGWLFLHQRHACPRVVLHWQERLLPRFRLPGVKAQLLAWLYLLVAALLLGCLILRR